ncbi:hypothetical protein J4205_03825 [Candidatus Pacearchaeota archaeon]|nr:hypothetical protein [Candidatus Pacearchaeota archaeon]
MKINNHEEKSASKGRIMREIISWTPIININDLMQPTIRSPLNVVYYLGKVVFTNLVLPAYIAAGLFTGNWTPSQYVEAKEERIESEKGFPWGENFADYDGDGFINVYEKVRFFDENGLGNEFYPSSMSLGEMRKMKKAIHNYESMYNKNGKED